MNGKFGNLGVATDKPSRMPIELPGGEAEVLVDEDGNEAYIEFLPWDSEPGRKFDQAQQREQVRKGFRQRSRAEMRNDAENIDIIKDQAERLAALATDWHLVDVDRKKILNKQGEPLPFSKADALELFMEPALGWLRRKAWTFIGNESNFMPSFVEELVDFAEHEFRLERRSGGATEREHLSNAERQIANLPNWRGPKTTALDEAPPFPAELNYLWVWFSEHCWGLAVNGMAIPRVTWEGLAAWCVLTDVTLAPWEVNAMVRLGNVRAAALTPKSTTRETGNGVDRPYRAGGKKRRGDHPR